MKLSSKNILSEMGDSARELPKLSIHGILKYTGSPRLSANQGVMVSEVAIPDVSFWQREIDFGKMAGAGMSGVIIRAGQNKWKDSEFENNWKNSKSAGLPRGMYWFMDSRYNMKKQADMMAAMWNQDPGELMVTADYEESYGGPWGGWQYLREFIEQLKYRGIGENRIQIYSNYWYWMARSPQRSAKDLNYFKKFDFHVASYTEDPNNVRIPAPWNDAKLWQKGKPSIGHELGVKSKEIDMNYYNGSLRDFAERFNLKNLTPHSPEIQCNGQCPLHCNHS